MQAGKVMGLHTPYSGSVRPSRVATHCNAQPEMYSRGLPWPKLVPSGIGSKQSLQLHQDRTSAQQRPSTVYTVRFSTAYDRGSDMLELRAGVQVALVGQDGRTVLHRVPPLFDSDAAEQELFEICKVADKASGANCRALSARQDLLRPQVKQRFQRGSIDEVCFLAPELGPLAGLLVGPEQGAWQPAEVTVASSRTRHTDRFICRQKLGDGGRVQAEYLAPLPENAVVYGSGDTAVVLSQCLDALMLALRCQEQATTLHRMGMLSYHQLKERLLSATAGLVAAGSCIAFSAGGPGAALPFALGGSAGMAYQWLLQHNVDALPGARPPRPATSLDKMMSQSPGGRQVVRVISSSSFRFLFIAVAALSGVWAVQALGNDGTEKSTEMRQLASGLLGFMMWKLALVGVTAAPPSPHDQPALDKAVCAMRAAGSLFRRVCLGVKLTFDSPVPA